MKNKTQWYTTMHLLEWLKLKRMSRPSVGKDVEELELSYTTGKNKKKNDTTILENSLSVCYKGKHILNIQLSNPTPIRRRKMKKWKMYIFEYSKICVSLINSSQKLEINGSQKTGNNANVHQ